MAGIFPDSGVAANQAVNTVDVPTTGCASGELFHSTSRCQPRFDPAAANAMMSELLNFMNSVGHVYDCSVMTNLTTALAATAASCNCPPGSGIVAPTLAPAATDSRFYVNTASTPDDLYWWNGATWTFIGTNTVNKVQVFANDNVTLLGYLLPV
jgi:hypothetical protein